MKKIKPRRTRKAMPPRVCKKIDDAQLRLRNVREVLDKSLHQLTQCTPGTLSFARNVGSVKAWSKTMVAIADEIWVLNMELVGVTVPQFSVTNKKEQK